MMSKIKLGFALCGSFCTFSQNITLMEQLIAAGYDIVPIMSFNAAKIDTRFGKASEHIAAIERLCKKSVIKTIEDAEPIGPTHMVDIMLVSPCTGNTLAKLANSITDTPVCFKITHFRRSAPCNFVGVQDNVEILSIPSDVVDDTFDNLSLHLNRCISRKICEFT